MNLYEMRDELKDIIAHDQHCLDTLPETEANVNVRALVKVHVERLTRYLACVEKQCEKDAEQSWRDNPDRSGGQFTQDEINQAGEWQ